MKTLMVTLVDVFRVVTYVVMGLILSPIRIGEYVVCAVSLIL